MNKEEVRRIYTEAFGECPTFDKEFFAAFSENCETYEENGKTVSILFKLPCKMGERTVYYIYAAATDRAKRRMGYMCRLLKRVQKQTSAPLFLCPANAELVRVYEKAGFKTAGGVSENGDIKIVPTKKQRELSALCEKVPDRFTLMFYGLDTDGKTVEFPFIMQ